MDSKMLLVIPIALAIVLVSGYTAGMFTGKMVAPGTATLYGQLTDSDTGLPVSGEPVTAGGLEAVTDSRGNYEITGIEPGTYTVVWGGVNYYKIGSAELLSEGQAMERGIRLSRKRQ